MKTAGAIKVFLSTSVVALAFAVAQTAMAQSDDPTTSRADVKAQTRAANKTNELWRGGEASLPAKPFQSEKLRADRKGETIAARRRANEAARRGRLQGQHCKTSAVRQVTDRAKVRDARCRQVGDVGALRRGWRSISRRSR